MAPRTSVPAVGSRAWLAGLFDAHVDAAFNVAYRIVWNRADAQDVVQTAFLQVAGHADQLRDPDRARSWLLRITYRAALALLRSRRDVPTDPTDLVALVDAAPGPEEAAVRADLAASIDAAIRQLPERLRVAFVLRDVEELPLAEVAAVLGIGESAAKMRVARARESLRISLTGRIRRDL